MTGQEIDVAPGDGLFKFGKTFFNPFGNGLAQIRPGAFQIHGSASRKRASRIAPLRTRPRSRTVANLVVREAAYKQSARRPARGFLTRRRKINMASIRALP